MNNVEYIKRGEHLANPNAHKQYAKLNSDFKIFYPDNMIGNYLKIFSIRGTTVDVNQYGEYGVIIAVNDDTFCELNFEFRYSKNKIFIRENSLFKNIDVNNLYFILSKEPSATSTELWIDVYLKLTEQGVPVIVLPKYNLSRMSEFYLNNTEIEYKSQSQINNLKKLGVEINDTTYFSNFGLSGDVESTNTPLGITHYKNGQTILKGCCKIKNINAYSISIGYLQLSYKDEVFTGIIKSGGEYRTVAIHYHADSNLMELMSSSIVNKDSLTNDCYLYLNQTFDGVNRY